MGVLSENNIKRATLSFLKGYYRYRPRTGDTQSSLDMRGEGGIIADGFLSFPMENGRKFLATFEATSYDTRKEVKYTIEKELLIWDSFTFASFLTSIVFTYTYIKDIFTVKDLGLYLTVALVLVLFTLFFFFYRLFFSPWHRYRYIYAIEQFKRYHADEQWIAIGEDIFANVDDKHLVELRNQCIYNGFGLIIVDQQINPQLSITPSRNEVFDNKRQVVQFFDLNELSRRMSQGNYKNLWQKAIAYLNILTPRSASGSLRRFRKTHYRQMGLTAISLLLVSGIFYKEIQDQSIVYVDEEAYSQDVIQANKNNKEELEGFLLDSAAFQPFNNKVKPYLEIEKEKSRGQMEEAGPEIIVYDRNNRPQTYDCERFYNFDKKLYLIEHSLHENSEAAVEAIKELERIKIDANTLWLGCFEARDEYVVYLNLLYTSKWEARADLRDLQEKLEKNQRSVELSIRPIDPPRDDW